MEQLQQLMSMMNAGCSALSWKTQDGKHLWGRNMDFNRLAQGSKISFIPRGTSYYMRGTTMENNLREQERRTSAYAAVGTGFLMIPSTPVLYEGINEKGLMGGQLYYREFAHFEQQVRKGTTALLPAFCGLPYAGTVRQRAAGGGYLATAGHFAARADAGNRSVAALGIFRQHRRDGGH